MVLFPQVRTISLSSIIMILGARVNIIGKAPQFLVSTPYKLLFAFSLVLARDCHRRFPRIHPIYPQPKLTVQIYKTHVSHKTLFSNFFFNLLYFFSSIKMKILSGYSPLKSSIFIYTLTIFLYSNALNLAYADNK